MTSWIVAPLLLVAAVACGDGTTSPSGPRIALAGRLERSGPLTLSLIDGTDTVPPSEVVWAASPSGAATFSTDTVTGATLLTPLATGALTLTGTSAAVSARRRLSVPAPPSVVLVLLASGNRDIWRVALDGGDTTRLTEDPADDRQPTARSGQVIFTSVRAAGSGLYTVNAAGGPATPLLVTGADLADPALSRDGKHLAYTSDVSGVPKMWVARSDGTQARRLAPGFGFDGAIEGWPAWSPDGKHLALMSTDPGEASLFVIDSSGSAQAPLVDTVSSFQPSWSPTGDQIVFVASPPGERSALFTIPALGGAPHRLTPARSDGGDSSPVWLPDGRIVYLATVTGGAELRWMESSSFAPAHPIPLPPGEPSSPAYLPPP